MSLYRKTAIIVLTGTCFATFGTFSQSADKRIGRLVVASCATDTQGSEQEPATSRETIEGRPLLVYCVTNRLQEGMKDSIPHFGAKQGPLSCIRCNLTIGPQHQPGQLVDITVRGMEVASTFEAACRYIQQRSRRNQAKVLVFVHGFNVQLEESVRRAAQLGADLDHDGPVIAFSWPSLGRLSKGAYLADRKIVDDSVPAFRQFLLALDDTFGDSKIQIIAHSLGCRLTSQTMASIAQADASSSGPAIRFANVVLAAADVDVKCFEETYAPALTTIAQRVTVYHSQSDVALAFSKLYNDGNNRLGLIGSPRGDIESVDYSALGGLILTHGFYCSHSVMIRDLRGVLAGTIPPSRRTFMRPRVVNQERQQDSKPALTTSP